MLLKNLGFKGKHNLQSRWGALPYVVVDQLPDLPVYKLKPESGMGKIRTLHRDHLLPIGSLVEIHQEREDQLPVHRPVTRAQRKSVASKLRQPEPEGNTSQVVNGETSESDCEVQPGCRLRVGRSSEIPDRIFDGVSDAGSNDEQYASSGEEEVADASEGDIPTGDETDGGNTIAEGNTPTGADKRSSPKVEKRPIKPVIRLTYDEAVRPKAQPLTIVHRGIVIRIG